MSELPRNSYYKIQFAAAKAALIIFSVFSIRSLRIFASAVVWIAWFFPTKSKRHTLKNIELCFPNLTPKERAKLAKKSLAESAKTALETPAMYMWGRDKILNLADRVENIEIYERAIEKKRGTILLAPHYGNWEMMRHFAASKSRFAVLYQPLKSPELDAAVEKLRSKNGVSALPATQRGIAALFKELRSGAVAAILPDSSPKAGSGVFAPFFGIETYTMTLLQKAARKTGAEVICCAAIRTPKGFLIRFCEVDEEIRGEDPREAAAAMNRAIERLVESDPSQYFWEYRRFKIRPEGEARFY